MAQSKQQCQPPTQPTSDFRKENLAKIEQGIENVMATPGGENRRGHPALSPETYAPGIDFVSNCKSYLSTEDYAKFDASIAKLPEPDGALEETFRHVRETCLALLDGRDDLKAQWDQIYGNKEVWAGIRGYRQEQA